MEVIEPISVHFTSVMCDFIKHARTAVTAKHQSLIRNAIFHVVFFAIFFSQIHHPVLGP